MKTDKDVEVPDDLAAVLAGDTEVLRIFQSMRPSCQREYVQWITEAKRDATRARRLVAFAHRIRDYGARHAPARHEKWDREFGTASAHETARSDDRRQ